MFTCFHFVLFTTPSRSLKYKSSHHAIVFNSKPNANPPRERTSIKYTGRSPTPSLGLLGPFFTTARAAAEKAEGQPDGERQGPPHEEDGVDNEAREQEEGEALPPPPATGSFNFVCVCGISRSFGRSVRYYYYNPRHTGTEPNKHNTAYSTYVHPDDVAVGPRGAGVHPECQVLVGVREDPEGLAERDEDLRHKARGLLGA